MFYNLLRFIVSYIHYKGVNSYHHINNLLPSSFSSPSLSFHLCLSLLSHISTIISITTIHSIPNIQKPLYHYCLHHHPRHHYQYPLTSSTLFSTFASASLSSPSSQRQLHHLCLPPHHHNRNTHHLKEGT